MPRIRFLLTFTLLACNSSPTTSTSGETGFPVTNPATITPNPPPSNGPWHHTVRTASSNDGLIFNDERSLDLVLHASVPSALKFPAVVARGDGPWFMTYKQEAAQ